MNIHHALTLPSQAAPAFVGPFRFLTKPFAQRILLLLFGLFYKFILIIASFMHIF